MPTSEAVAFAPLSPPAHVPAIALDQTLMDAWKERHSRNDVLRALRFRRYIRPPAIGLVAMLIWSFMSRG